MFFHQPLNSLSNYNYNAFFYTSKTFDLHFHKNMEVIYVIHGKVNCTVNSIEYHLCKGDFGLCLPNDTHKYEPEKDSLYWVIVFSEDFVRYFSNKIAGKSSNGFLFRCDETTEKYIVETLIHNKAPSTLAIKSCLYALCGQYMNSVTFREKNHNEIKTISHIANYLAENHTKNITLTDVANFLGYDYNYTSRLFKNTFNINFTDLLNIYRLETAIELLENTDKSITTIALESGFQSVRSFNSFFKKQTNTSPTQHRKASKK